MKKFRILMYRPAIDHRWLDNAISFHSLLWNGLFHLNDLKTLWLLRASHTEIWIPDENEFCGRFDGPEFNSSTYLGITYTSTMDGKNNGAVKRPASDVLKNPERWYYYEFEVCNEAFDKMILWLDLQVANNTGYDWHGDILKFFLPYRKQNVDDTHKICSGISWIAFFKAMCRDLVESKNPIRTKMQEIYFELIKNSEDDLFSPLLMSYKIYKAGAVAIDLATGLALKGE